MGGWKRVSASSTASTGERSETPYGPNPAGFLTYTADGRVTSGPDQLRGENRSRWAVGARRSLEEQAEAFRTFVAYFRPLHAHRRHRVTHHIEISSIQNFVSRDLVRSVKFQGDQIILVTPPAPVNGKIQTVVN